MRTASLLAVVLSLVLALPVAAPSAAAHPLPHEEPRILNPRPAPGSVVAGGSVGIAALIAADAPVEARRVLVDGEEVPSTGGSGDHATVGAVVELDGGMHTVEVQATAGGTRTSRTWAFTAGAVDVTRLEGPTRFETAIAIARDLYPQEDSAGAVVLARGDSFPDALAAAPLATALNAPVLLSTGDRLHHAVVDELHRLLPDGATVHLLGGEQALGAQVAADVRAEGFAVERVAGPNRYATAATIHGALPNASTAVVASGEIFSDALASSGGAAAYGYPLLLTARSLLPPETAAVLSEGGFDTVLVVGGDYALTGEVVADIRAQAGDAEVVRVGGHDRYATAAAVGRTFFPDRTQVAVASGERFPDALAGGPHAAARSAPLLLVPGDELADEQAEQVRTDRPARASVYGGRAAVEPAAVADLQRAAASAGGPSLARFTPAPGAAIQTLDEFVVEFDQELDVERSIFHVTVDGNEVEGTVGPGDFDTTMVFTVAQPPVGLESGSTYPVEVTVAATDGTRWRHLERRLQYRKPIRTLNRGDSGEQVADLQRALQANGYWVGPTDGVYGLLTHQAVLALQKAHGLTRDGIYGPATREVLEADPGPPAPRSSSGLVVEVDKTRQILLVVRDGEVVHVFNTSTGTGEPYTHEGDTYIATTPSGSYSIHRQIDGWRESHLGRLYRPKYFVGGIAVHGSTSVPAYPASHGCVRVTIEAMDFLWDRLPIGTGVLVY